MFRNLCFPVTLSGEDGSCLITKPIFVWFCSPEEEEASVAAASPGLRGSDFISFGGGGSWLGKAGC